MTLFIRCITAMTVVLGMATMAVSAYAAKTEVAAAGVLLDAEAPAVVLLEAEDLVGVSLEAEVAGVSLEAEVAGVSLEAEVDDETSAVPSLGGVSGPETAALMQGPQPIPTASPVYAVPLDAASLSRLSPRQNASFQVQVWPVLSLKPLPLTLPLPVPSGSGIPSDQLAAMLQESQVTGIPWQIFAAIARIESDFGRNMSTSWAGAIGYGQFLPVTWADYGNGGDPYNFRDVIPAMGRYLLVAGVLNDPPRAIYAYNHSWSYVTQVLSYAASYGYQPTN